MGGTHIRCGGPAGTDAASKQKARLEVYAQALTPAKRAAHQKVVETIRLAEGTLIVPSCSHAEAVVACK